MENQSWESRDLGISFSILYGRINVFSNTLKAIGMPPYFRFLFDTEHKQFAVECCEYESSGSLQLSEDTSRDRYELKSMDLVRFVYQTCGWDPKLTYRIKGTAIPERGMVIFDLTTALKVAEGRLAE